MSANETERLEAVAGNVRRLRVAAGINLDRLAAASGVGRSTLARLEAGQGNPTIETLFGVADALGVSIGALLAEPAAAGVYVQRAADAVRVSGGVDASVIDRLALTGTAEILSIRFPAGKVRKARAHAPGVVEHLLITSGVVEAGPVGQTVVLEAGDFLRFTADVPHRYAARSADAFGVVVMTHPHSSSRQGVPRTGFEPVLPA
jgi:transcriptional regulator with XRE-family HTH domain